MGKVIEKARRLRLADMESFPSRDPQFMELVGAWARSGLGYRDAVKCAEWGIFPMGGAGVDAPQVILQNVPAQPYIIDPAQFFDRTEGNFITHTSFAFADSKAWQMVNLPNVGVYAKVVVQFDGQLVVGVANATSTAQWPYGILESIQFAGNGNDDLFNCSGLDLKALEHARYPYNGNPTDDDLVGGGVGSGINLAVGTIPLRLTYEIPVAFEEASLVAGLFAQGRSLSINVKGKDAPVARVATLGGGGTVTLSGTWYISVEFFDVPMDQSGRMVLPDVRLLHGFNMVERNHAQNGDHPVELTRGLGQLQRLFAQSVKSTVDPQTFYSPADKADIAEFRLEFGANKTPKKYSPAQTLLSRNVRDYGKKPPYSFAIMDLSRYNSRRDAIQLEGLTELRWVTKVAVAPTGGNGRIRTVEETLFA